MSRCVVLERAVACDLGRARLDGAFATKRGPELIVDVMGGFGMAIALCLQSLGGGLYFREMGQGDG